MSFDEHVVLLDSARRPCGTAPKSTVHTTDTPLHLAFSCYLFRGDELLLTRRADSKRAFPGIWTNTCCGHPAPGEALEDAVVRRVRHELGLSVEALRLVLSDFAYRAVDPSGIVENEYCPVFVGTAVGEPVPLPAEVASVRWVPWAEVVATAAGLSPWAQLQIPHLAARLPPFS